MVDIQIIGDDTTSTEETGHNHEIDKGDTPGISPNP